MAIPQKSSILPAAQESIRKNLKFATLSFLFIIAYVNVFQKVFGAENSIVGVIFTIMMSASMARDLTSTPFKHLLAQSAVLVLMAAAACLVVTLNPWIALPINFIMIFLILYLYTYEYSGHLYFPYILSYLFLIFISPSSPEQLPRRIMAMVTGAVCIILYQLVMGRNRAAETVSDVLLTLIGEAKQYIFCLLSGSGTPESLEDVRKNIRRLSRMVYDRRRKELCISDANFAVVDSGRGLEHLLILLSQTEHPEKYQDMLEKTLVQLDHFEAYVNMKTTAPHLIARDDFITDVKDLHQAEFYDSLEYIRNHLVHMADPEKKSNFRPTLLSLSIRIQAALKISKVRVVYALRVALLLSLATLLVESLNLPHGKWLLFTLASVSLPYADDVGQKAGKRFFATVAGGVFSVILYSLVPSPAGRTVIMMLSGYLSFYFSDYTGTFTCSTIGALGGAVFMNAFGWAPVGRMLLIRLAYVLAGIVIAYAANCLLFPYHRSTATETLLKKYDFASKLLSKICRQGVTDTQFYYHLVIQSQLIEEKLYQNTSGEERELLHDKISECRALVRAAHRSYPQREGLISQ